MKKFYFKRSDLIEETPILERLERRPTLVTADNVTTDELHAMAARTLSMTNTERGSSSSGEWPPTPTAVITDSDLASSWIYTRRRDAANESRDFTSSADHQQQPEVEMRQVPLASSDRICSRTICCFTFFFVLFICIMGILGCIGIIIYLEVFAQHQQFSPHFSNSSPHHDAPTTSDATGTNIILVTSSTFETDSTFVVSARTIPSQDDVENFSANDLQTVGNSVPREAKKILTFVTPADRFTKLVSREETEKVKIMKLGSKVENDPKSTFIWKRVGKSFDVDVTDKNEKMDVIERDGNDLSETKQRNVSLEMKKMNDKLESLTTVAVAVRNYTYEAELSTGLDSTMSELGNTFQEETEQNMSMNVSEKNMRKNGGIDPFTEDGQTEVKQTKQDLGFSDTKWFERKNEAQSFDNLNFEDFSFSTKTSIISSHSTQTGENNSAGKENTALVNSATEIPQQMLDVLLTTEFLNNHSRSSHLFSDTRGLFVEEAETNITESSNPSRLSHAIGDNEEVKEGKSSEVLSVESLNNKGGPEDLVKIFETIERNKSNPLDVENVEGDHSELERSWLQPRVNVDRSEVKKLSNPKSVIQERRNYLKNLRTLLFYSS